jgi:predicted TIM-barrel fold metal-dependent hydrolase
MDGERLTIVSADCHAGVERMADYRRYVDPRFRAGFDDYCAAIDAFNVQQGAGLTAGGATSAGQQGLWDIAARTRCLDADGVAAEVIFAQGSAPFGMHPPVGGGVRLQFTATAEQDAAGCRAYNRWLADLCANDPVRHLGIARVPLADIGAAVAEVEFAARSGLRGGVHLPPLSANPTMPFLNDPAYEPFWAACSANQMALNMHGGAGVTYPDAFGSREINLAETDWLSHRGLSHLIFGGVFERHRTLHLAITEQRAHWVHQVLEDFDSIWEFSRRFNSGPQLRRKPSEYFRSNCFIGASFLSPLECKRRGEIGAECFMWGSDYPHNEGAWPYTATALRYTFGQDVPLADLKAMLGGNAARCYYVDLAALRPVADKIGPTELDLRVPVERLPGETPGEAPVRSWAFRRHGAWH